MKNMSPKNVNSKSDHDLSPPVLSDEEALVVSQEEETLRRVMRSISRDFELRPVQQSIDADLISLREQIREARGEDQAALVEHMTRLAALRALQESREERQSDEDFFRSPYFGRLCYEEEDEEGALSGKVKELLIGKQSFFSKDGRVKVVDWRSSPISQLYYRMKEGEDFYEEYGQKILAGRVTLRRTLSIQEGEVLRIQYGTKSERVLTRDPKGRWTSEQRIRSSLSGGEGRAARVSPSRIGRGQKSAHLPEITALIDPEQFQLITHERSGVVIIQGGAGTGKTTIALHRIAYLCFQNPSRFTQKKILILTPGEALKRYIENVLPSLDVDGVPIHTFGRWAFDTAKSLNPALKHHRHLEDTPIGAQRLKRHPIMISLIENMIKEESRAIDLRMETLGGKSLLNEWVKRRNLPLMDRFKKLLVWMKRERPTQRNLKAQIEKLIKTLKRPDELWLDLLADRPRIEKTLKNHQVSYYQWEVKQLTETVRLQAKGPERFDDLDTAYQVGVDGERLQSDPRRAKLDTEDCAIILRIGQLYYGALTGPSGRVLSYEHVMVDEAQDLSPIALQMLCYSTPPNAPVTLAGDTAQRVVFDNGFSRWRELTPYLPKRTQVLPPLTVSYRSTRQVMSFARGLLGDLDHDWSTRDVREGAPVSFFGFDTLGEGISFIAESLSGLMDREPQATVAVVARTPSVAQTYAQTLQRANVPKLRWVRHQDFIFKAGIDVTDALQIKGLEYDYIIAVDVSDKSYPLGEHNRHLLHVVATRAAHQLWIVCAGGQAPSPLLPEELIETGTLTLPEE